MIYPAKGSNHNSSAVQDGGSLRWVDYARRSMQRLGFVKWVLRLASQPQTLESLTRTFAASITKVVPVPPGRTESFEKYVLEQHLNKQRYRGELTSAQLQDIHLSDPNLPSRSGAITGDVERKGYRHAVYVEIPTWAARLRLLRDQNYTVTDRGRVLLMFGKQPEDSFATGERNPLYLNISERYIALFCLLDADGDLLRAMYERLISLKTFTRAQAGDAAVEALQELRKTRLKSTSTGRLQQLQVKADRTIAAVRNQSPSGLGPRESIATPRTEPLVDCGVLTKPWPDSYEYSLTAWGKDLLGALISESSVSRFLYFQLSSAMSLAVGRSVSAGAPSLDTVRRPYSELRSGLGYVSLRELAVAAVGQALSSPEAQLFEINALEHALREASAQGNRYVRLTAGRTGGSVLVRIDKRAFAGDDTRD